MSYTHHFAKDFKFPIFPISLHWTLIMLIDFLKQVMIITNFYIENYRQITNVLLLITDGIENPLFMHSAHKIHMINKVCILPKTV